MQRQNQSQLESDMQQLKYALSQEESKVTAELRSSLNDIKYERERIFREMQYKDTQLSQLN